MARSRPCPCPVPPDPGGDDHVLELQQGLRLSDAEGIAAERLDGAAEDLPAPVSVPSDPGGDDHVLELQQGLRLSDAEGIAAERLDGAAEDSLMPVSVPSDPGGDDHVLDLQQGLRLSDAEGIAAERLDGAAEGSLKEALAIARTQDEEIVRLQLADIAEVGESFAAGPLVPLIDARFTEGGRTQVLEPHYAFSPMPRPPVLDVGIALVTLAHVAPRRLAAPEIAGGGEPAPMPSKDWPSKDLPSNNLPSNDLPSEDLPSAERPTEDRPGEDWHGVAGETHSEPAMATLPDAAAEQNFEPLTSALDVAARLAADASVAADALENLKRLLEHKQLLESQPPLLDAIPAAARTTPRRRLAGLTLPPRPLSRRCRCPSTPCPMPVVDRHADRRCSCRHRGDACRPSAAVSTCAAFSRASRCRGRSASCSTCS